MLLCCYFYKYVWKGFCLFIMWRTTMRPTTLSLRHGGSLYIQLPSSRHDHNFDDYHHDYDDDAHHNADDDDHDNLQATLSLRHGGG